MDIRLKHPWPNRKRDAFQHQRECADRIIIDGNTQEPTSIAGVDVAVGFGGETIYAVTMLLSYPELEEIERRRYRMPVSFPRRPELAYYSDGQAMVNALSHLEHEPDVLLVNGHGIADVSGCGLASMLGLVFDKPAIGCARRLIDGRHSHLGETKGSCAPIELDGREVGLALRTKDSVKPLFISPGHRCDLDFSRRIVVGCLRGFRLPEPLRVAHLLANRYKQRQERDRKRER